MPYESIPPMIIIGGAVALMGALQGGVNKLATGKPKRTNMDMWDYQLEKRDAQLAGLHEKAGGGSSHDAWRQEFTDTTH